MSIAFLGVTVPYYPVYDKLGWTVTDALESIKETILEVKGQADIIVLLSHLGILDDQAVAEAVPEIDVILESHTHHCSKMDKWLMGYCWPAPRNTGIMSAV